MRNKDLFFAALSAALLSGCAMWDAGYTENRSVTKYRVNMANKYPITYSVTMSTTRDDIIAVPTSVSLREMIEASLTETGLFSDIAYGSKKGEDSYHIEFTFRQAGMLQEETGNATSLAASTLFLVPIGEVLTFDGTATLCLREKPIYSTAKAEEIRCLNWLPMAPVGLVMNSWTVWFWIERGTVHALVNDIAREHCRRYLLNVDYAVMPVE